MLKVAVIGLGDVAGVHLSAIQANPDVELVAVCDVDVSKRKTTEVNFYTDHLEMLDKEELDCVHICLPHHLHYEVTKAFVERGVHVFLEKPITHNLEDAKRLKKLEEKHQDVKICVCLQNRFNETFIELVNEIKSGELGNVTGVKGLVTWSRPPTYFEEKPWRGKKEFAGGGVMINQAIHTLDLLQLLGGEIKTVRGSIDRLSDYPIDVEDTATAKIDFKNGARGLFFATIVHAENSSVEIDVALEEGNYIIKDSILTKVDKDGNKTEIIEDAKLPGKKFYYGASHAKLIDHFYACIKNDSEDYIHVKDAYPSMKAIDLIRKSSLQQKKLPFDHVKAL